MPLFPLLLLLVAALMAMNALDPPASTRGIGLVEVTKADAAAP